MLLLTVAEEAGLLGARQLARAEINADFGFVVDNPGPPGSMVVQGETGEEFHAGVLERAHRSGSHGADAQWVTNRVLARLPVGTVNPGTTLEILPMCVTNAGVDFAGAVYAHTPQQVQACLELVRVILRETATRYELDFVFRTGRSYPGYTLPVSAPVVELAVAAATYTLAKPILLRRQWASDANILNAMGLPTVNLGGAWHEGPDGTAWAFPGELTRAFELLVSLVSLSATRPTRWPRGGHA